MSRKCECFLGFEKRSEQCVVLLDNKSINCFLICTYDHSSCVSEQVGEAGARPIRLVVDKQTFHTKILIMAIML